MMNGFLANNIPDAHWRVVNAFCVYIVLAQHFAMQEICIRSVFGCHRDNTQDTVLRSFTYTIYRKPLHYFIYTNHHPPNNVFHHKTPIVYHHCAAHHHIYSINIYSINRDDMSERRGDRTRR